MMIERIRLPDYGEGIPIQAPEFPSDALAVDTETTGLDAWLGDRVFAIVICDTQGRYLYAYLGQSDASWMLEYAYQGNLLLDQKSPDRSSPDFPGEGQGPLWQAVSAADWLFEGDLPCEAGAWTLDEVRKLLAGPRPKIFHNCKFDLRMMFWTFGWEIGGDIHDTMLMARLMVPAMKTLKLKVLGDEILNMPAREEAEVLAWLRDHKKMFLQEFNRLPCYMDVPFSIMSKYAAGDVHRTMLLFRRWWISLHDKRREVYDYEMELCFETMMMEDVGMRVDIEYTKNAYIETEKRIAELEKKLFEITGIEFNCNSDKQMVRWLLTDEGLGLRGKMPDDVFRENKMVTLTDKGALSVCRDALKLYREYDETEACTTAMLRGMLVGMDRYYKHFLEKHYVNSREQTLLRPSILQHTAKTGRFSIVSPALQTIPSRSSGRLLDFERDEIPDVRRCFVPTYPSWSMYSWDYSQIELRLIAFYGQEKAMIQAFADGKDIHDVTTHDVWDGRADLEDPVVWKRCRTFSKMVNFGIAYGIQEESFHQTLGTPMDVVRAVIGKYHKTYPGVSGLMDAAKTMVRRKGYLHTIFGRLLLPSRKKAYTGTNYLIQGTAADILKRAMVKVRRWANANGIRLVQILPVHDEIIMQIHPEDDTPENLRAIKAVMEDFPEFSPLPITVGCKRIKAHWSDTEEVEINAA